MNSSLQTVTDIIKRLENAFGEPKWRGRGDPLSSLVLTMMSQSTNDRNRDTAYQRLKERFPEWQMVKDAPPRDIADAIRPAGLSNQKSARIKDVLNWIQHTYGSLDLDSCVIWNHKRSLRRLCSSRESASKP